MSRFDPHAAATYGNVTTAPDVIPPIFTGLVSATDRATQGEVELAWVAATDSGSGVSHYRVYYHTNNDPITIVAQGIRQEAPASAVNAIIGGLVDNTPYYFLVRAVDWSQNEDVNVVVRSATSTHITGEIALSMETVPALTLDLSASTLQLEVEV